MGGESDPDEMDWIADLALRHDLWVLSDEAYFNVQYSGKPKSIVSLPGMQERTVILYTFSKTYAMTGWRLGAAIGSADLMKIFSKPYSIIILVVIIIFLISSSVILSLR